MSADDPSERAIELLIAEAWSLGEQGRFGEALRVASRAFEGAQRLGSLRLEIQATRVEAAALRMLGERAAALTKDSWILGVAQDPARRAELAWTGVEYEVADAYVSWVGSARFLPEVPAEPLLEVLAAGETYLRRVGKAAWRAGLLYQRAQVLDDLGQLEAAIAVAEEGLALRERASGPGPSLAAHRWALGDLLQRANRSADAARHHLAVLADERSTPYGRSMAHQLLARCMLATDRPVEARRHAEEAVRLKASMGDDVLQTALEALTDVSLAQDDLLAARTASDRMLKGARHLNTAIRLYYALHNVAKVALAEKNGAQAGALLDEAQPYADALDRSRGGTIFRDEIARLRAQADALPSTGT